MGMGGSEGEETEIEEKREIEEGRGIEEEWASERCQAKVRS